MSDDKLTFEEAHHALELAAYCDELAEQAAEIPFGYTDLKLAARGLRTLVLAAGWPESISIPARRAHG